MDHEHTAARTQRQPAVSQHPHTAPPAAPPPRGPEPAESMSSEPDHADHETPADDEVDPDDERYEPL